MSGETKGDNGGAAFPGPAQISTRENIHEGMSLLDYFAAAALTGIRAGLDGKTAVALLQLANEEGTTETKLVAEMAYNNAYAMLAEREKRRLKS